MFWSKAERRTFSGFMVDDHRGFVEIAPQKSRTRSIDEYREIVRDPARWATLKAELLDEYFDDPIDMFPYEGGVERREKDAATPQGDVWRRGLWWRTLDRSLNLAIPARFFQIQADLIKRRFPGGRNQTIGDSDIRDLISCLRYVFARNFSQLVWVRRVWCAFVSAIVLLAFACFAVSFDPAAFFPPGMAVTGHMLRLLSMGLAGLVAVLTVATFFIYRFWSNNEYGDAVEKSCSNVRTGLQTRLQELVAIIPLIFHRIDRDKFELKKDDLLKQWPDEVRKWSRLAFWMAMRVQYLEFFMQVEMWRIRRIHAWTRLIGLGLSTAIFLVSLAILEYLALALPWGAPAAELGLADLMAALVLFALALMSYRTYLPDFDLVERTLRTNDMKGSKDSKFHEAIEEFMFQEKHAQLHEEEKRSGRGT
ncbi:MAG: hypothetical protein WDM86_08295 [Rhizomicrobium sp.]